MAVTGSESVEDLPLVSVVIPALNAASTLERAIRSVRSQTYSRREIIVVDDGSSDGTTALMERLRGPDLDVIRNAQPTGASNARNQGILRSRGEIVAFLDADDEWFPNKLSLQVPAFLANRAASFSATGAAWIDTRGIYGPDQYAGRKKSSGPDAWHAILRANFIATPTVLAWRRQLIDVGLFDVSLRVAEDQDMWIKLALAGELVYLDRPLIIIHEQKKSLTAGQPLLTMQEIYTFPMLRRHLERLTKRLTRREQQLILAERYARAGRGAYAESPLRALRYLILGTLYGYEPVRNALYIVASSPPALRIREWLASTVSGKTIS